MILFLPLGVICLDVMPRTASCYQSDDKAIQGKRPEPQETREAETT